jgi:DNA invertase Pin-like site-specific DNA recombinase
MRVSTSEQTATQAAGFAIDEAISDDGVSGVSTTLAERPEGRRLFDKLRAGDVLVVRWVDRLGRNYEDVREAIEEFMRRGIIIRTVINNFTFDGSTKDPMQKAVRDALVAFTAATAKRRPKPRKPLNGPESSIPGQTGRRRTGSARTQVRQPVWGASPATRESSSAGVQDMLASGTIGMAQIAREARIARQTVYRIKDDPAGAEAALATWEM